MRRGGIVGSVLIVCAFACGFLLGSSARKPPTKVPPVRVKLPPPAPALPDPAINHALAENGATASGGKFSARLIDGNFVSSPQGAGAALLDWRQSPSDAFIITLRNPVPLTRLCMLLGDDTAERFCRYKIETRPACEGPWMMVVDYTYPEEQRRGWQTIFFQQRSVQQIRVTAAYSSDEGPVQVVELQAFSGPQAPQPGTNLALAARGTRASGGINPDVLIDGNDWDYGDLAGYAYADMDAQQSFIVTFKEEVTIDRVRFLLWDKEPGRFYRYKLEGRSDFAETWTLLADHSGDDERCRSWQLVQFMKQPLRQLRLTGTFCSANRHFHVVEIQAALGGLTNHGADSARGEF
ncbi:MAG TPA: hypothetical protein VEK08_21475 [Planctomycetota bacterium]|nr:hypothetical protein [Planctomycetota bacterium]